MCRLHSVELIHGDEDRGTCLGFSFAAYLDFLGGMMILLILKDAARSSAAGQGFRCRWACSYQPASCPRHLLVVTLAQNPSCSMCCVTPAESPCFPVILPTAPASGTVSGGGGLGCGAAWGSFTLCGGSRRIFLGSWWWGWPGVFWRCWWARVGVGPLPVVLAGTTGPEGADVLSFGGMGRPGGDQEADVPSHGGAGMMEPSSIVAGMLSGDCLVSFSMSSHLPQWRTGS